MNATGEAGKPQEPCGCDGRHVHEALCALFDDGQLTPERAEQIRKEFAECPSCSGRMQSEALIRELLQRCRCDDPAPQALYQRITAQIRFTARG